MVFGFASRFNSMPTWHELQHAILRNFGGSDDVKPVEVFAKHLQHIYKDAPVCLIAFSLPHFFIQYATLTIAFNVFFSLSVFCISVMCIVLTQELKV